MSYFQQGYHLLSMILQYVWGLIAALSVYVVLPVVATAVVLGILTALLKGRKVNVDEQL